MKGLLSTDRHGRETRQAAFLGVSAVLPIAGSRGPRPRVDEHLIEEVSNLSGVDAPENLRKFRWSISSGVIFIVSPSVVLRCGTLGYASYTRQPDKCTKA